MTGAVSQASSTHYSSPYQTSRQYYCSCSSALVTIVTTPSATKMGAALSSRAEWTSASEGKGKLDFSKTNEALLSDVVHYVEALCREHQREAEVIFKRSFAWTSSLSLSSFDRLKPPDYTTRYCITHYHTICVPPPPQ